MKRQEMRQRLYTIFEAELEMCSGLVKPHPTGAEQKSSLPFEMPQLLRILTLYTFHALE
jgi:hypothetical protein